MGVGVKRDRGCSCSVMAIWCQGGDCSWCTGVRGRGCRTGSGGRIGRVGGDGADGGHLSW